uniref:Putative secreted protein n=1 Tax=Panstrongylus lignarius TaxID=156445 RepID=A0A224Y6S3_9HEMI
MILVKVVLGIVQAVVAHWEMVRKDLAIDQVVEVELEMILVKVLLGIVQAVVAHLEMVRKDLAIDQVVEV